VAIIETPFILDIAKQNYDYKIFNTHLINKKYLLFFGTIGLLKGCGLIRDIIFDLFQRNSNIYFVFVGKSKNHLGYQKGIDIMDQIKQAASSYLNRVIHFDPLSHDQLYPIIENSYAVVLPSIIDNFPNTCLEAMAHKRVVIGANGSSFEQLIDNGINGFLFQKGNARDLLKVIEIALLLSNKERSLIGEKAYERILKLQPEIVVNQLIDFYKQTIINFNSTLIKNQNK
jgi:glycosyltransferase involved in cell wall biosynthesis